MKELLTELEFLLLDWERGMLDGAGVERVREILRCNEEARKYFVQIQTLNWALSDEAQMIDRSSAPPTAQEADTLVAEKVRNSREGVTFEERVIGLWQEYFPRLVALARKKLQDLPRIRADEEDVAQEVFQELCLAVHTGRIQKLDDPDELWNLLGLLTLRRIASLQRQFVATNRDSRTVEQSLSEQLQDLMSPEPGPDVVAEKSDELRSLFDILGNEKDRSILLIRMQGCTNTEIAQALGVSESVVERRLSRIRRLLQKKSGQREDSSNFLQ